MLLITNGRVFTMDGRCYETGSVLIEGTTIKKVGPMEEVTCPHGTKVLDAMGGWILPGLIESHCHVGITEENKGTVGDDCNEGTNPINPTLRALDGINPMDHAFVDAAKCGITACMVGPGSTNVVGGQFVLMKTMGGPTMESRVVLAPAAMKIALGENPKSAYGTNGNAPATRMAIAALLRKELQRAKDYFMKKEQAAKTGDAFTMDHDLEPWQDVFTGAIPLKAHVHRGDDIVTAIRIAKEFGLNMTLDHCTEGHLVTDAVAASGFGAIVGPSLSFKSKVEVQFTHFKTPGILQKAGVTVAITTDHPVTLIQTLPICAGFAAREGMGVEEALKAITINPAKLLGVSHRMGSLTKGKDADVAVFSSSPMEVFTKCLYTVIDGSVVYDHRKGGQ